MNALVSNAVNMILKIKPEIHYEASRNISKLLLLTTNDFANSYLIQKHKKDLQFSELSVNCLHLLCQL